MLKTGKDLRRSSPSCTNGNTQSRLPRTTFRQLLKMSKEGDCTMYLGKLCQCSITCMAQKCFLVFRWNLLYSTLCPLSHVLALATTKKKKKAWLLPLCVFPSGICTHGGDSPEPPLLQAQQSSWPAGDTLLMQHRILLAFLTANAHSWLVFSLVFTRTPRFF